MNNYTKMCPKCNAPMPLSSRFCPQCGARFSLPCQTDIPFASDTRSPSDPVSGPVPISPKTFRGYLLADLEIFIGSKYSVYMQKFSQRRQGKFTFNWCAALFPAEWLLYRKMWKTWLCFYGIQILWGIFYNGLLSVMSFFLGFLSFAKSHLGPAILCLLIYWLIPGLLLGFLGDGLYWRHIRNLLIRHQCFRRPPVYDEALVSTLQEEGGTLPIQDFLLICLVCCLPSWAGSALIKTSRNMVLKLLNAMFW